jgi:hypothetical protein
MGTGVTVGVRVGLGVSVEVGVRVGPTPRGILQAARARTSRPARRRKVNFGFDGVINEDYTN